MGNAQLVPKADNNNFHITESFLQDFQKHVSLVDHAVTGLARGIDIMSLTCKRSLQQRDLEVSNKTELLTTHLLQSNVLYTINEHVAENKAILIDAVRNCLNFIVENFAGYIEGMGDSQTDLEVNKYDANEWDCEKDFRKLSAERLKKELAFCIMQCDIQKQEIDILKKKEDMYIQQIGKLQIQCKTPGEINIGVQTESEDAVNLLQNLNTKPTKNTGRLRKNKNINAKDHSDFENRMTFNDGKDDAINIKHIPARNTSRENQGLTTVDSETQTCYDENSADVSKNNSSSFEKEILMKEIEEYKNQIESLNIELQMMKNMKTVRVQMYSPFTFSASTAENEVMKRVRTKLKYQSIELITSRCNTRTCLPHIPLLISRDSTDFLRYLFRKPAIEQTVIKDFKGLVETKHIGAVIYYRMKESDLHSEIEQSNDEGLGLGGVFRVGHSSSIYRSTLNDIAVDGIVDFILNAGEITQKFEDTPL